MASIIRSLIKKTNMKDVVMVILALASVLLLLYEIVFNLDPGQLQAIGNLDLFISFVFLCDFFVHYLVSPDKKRFFRRHWWEIFAAIPFTSSLAAPLLAIKIAPSISVLQILRIVRLVVRIRILLEVSLEYTRHSYIIYISTLISFVIFSGAAGFFFFESGKNPNVHSYWDAVWWAIVTSTTIGYGDIYPVTPGGRVIAVIVMLIGIAALGTYIATVDSFFLGKRLKEVQKSKRPS